jgi:hypothetical protein
MKLFSIFAFLTASIFVSWPVLAAFPMISPIANQVIQLGTRSTDTLSFQVKDDTTPPAQIILTSSSDNPSLVPQQNIILGGSGSDRTVRVIPQAGKWGIATITITATDNDGDNDVETFSVEVVRTMNP